MFPVVRFDPADIPTATLLLAFELFNALCPTATDLKPEDELVKALKPIATVSSTLLAESRALIPTATFVFEP